ncbi:MAG: fused MFS/spermidine synthase, partial [Planctomycetes bacterium]|nr:fused MFS/spermidine synthase [Planctomycetota bacterium]
LADRTKRPAFLYAMFELGIAAFALAFPWLVDAVRAVYLGIGTAAPPVLFALAFLLLVIPTFCMGTTLPLLARATVADAKDTGRDIGFLYSMNIVGAVLGAAGTGFVLMESQGVLGATRWAAAVNAVVGIVGWLAFRGVGTSAAATAAPAATASPATRAQRAALVAAFASGFVGLAAQVTWTRLLTFSLQGFTWTFSAILATFLAGLALGGAVFGRMASASKDPARLLGRLQIAVGVACAGVLLGMNEHHELTRTLWGVAGGMTQDLGARHRAMLVLAAGAILFVPAFLMGGAFPVATALYQRGLGDLGSRIGRLYAVNTVGCVLGSLLAGFVLQPLVGPAISAAIVAGLATVAGVVVLRMGSERSTWRFVGFAEIGVVATFALVAAAGPNVPFILRSHVFAGDRAREVELVDEHHGQVCTVSVVRNTRERFDLLYTDEFEAAGTKPEYRYMRMLAHLPVALARDPSRTLVICFGTGTTSGSVATHSDVKTLDIVEISPEVLAAAYRFKDVNKDVLHGAGRSDLDVRVHVDDGRHFVLRSEERWGVISLEPLMPYTPAAIHFYTEDFYRTCAPRLAPGGLMCQWIPLQGMSGDDFRKLVAAFVAVFPESAMFFVDGAVALVGGPDGVELSWARVAQRLSDPRVADDLRSVGFADPARSLATFVAGGEKLRAFVKDDAAVTDERPVLEFHPIPPNTALPWLGQNIVQMRDLRAGYEHLPVDVTGAADGDRAAEALFLALRSGNHVLDGMVHVETSSYLTRLGRKEDAFAELQSARDSYARAVALDPGNETARRSWEGLEREWWTILGGVAIDKGDFAQAEKHILRALEFRGQRQQDVAWTRLAEARNGAKKFDGAIEAACEAMRLFPGSVEARAERAFARGSLGDVEGASVDYVHAAIEAVRPATVSADARGEATLDALPMRFRSDAERAWGAYGTWLFAARVKGRFILPRMQVEDALKGTLPGKLSRRSALRIAAADTSAAKFRDRLLPTGLDALEAIERIRLAEPAGGADDLVAWLGAPVLGAPSDAVRRAAAEALVEIDPARTVDLLTTAKGSVDLEVVASAARAKDRRVVRPLIRLLRSDDYVVRTAAHRALFALTRGEAPHLATLDTSLGGTTDYRRACLDVESWWAREEDRFELGR